MDTPCWKSQVFLLLWISSGTVSSYEDLRDKSCRNKTTYSEVAAERTQWFGSVRLTMECDPGYDLPLNAPQNSTLTCLPHGSTWQPDYLPDCNDKIVPKSAQMTMQGHFSKAKCDSLGAVTVNKDLVSFASAHRVNLTQMCSGSRLRGCIAVHALTSCGGDAAVGRTKPHVILLVDFSISSATSWDTYNTESVGVALSILRDLEPGAQSSHVNVSIQPRCQGGTVGVLRAGSELVCRGCSLGHFLNTELKTCLPCLPGYYGDTPLSTTCKLCPGMSAHLDDSVWQRINSVVPNRAHAISSCPIMYKHKNGTVEVRVPPALDPQHKQIDMEDADQRKPPDTGHGNGLYLDIKTVALALTCLVMAAVCIA